MQDTLCVGPYVSSMERYHRAGHLVCMPGVFSMERYCIGHLM